MTKPVNLAQTYMASFYGQAPLDKMEPLLAVNLIFDGPFQKFSTAKSYLDSLKANPPRNVHYKMEEIYEKGNSVCFIYEFSKPGVNTRMAQTFEINDGKISKIKLIFDTSAFS